MDQALLACKHHPLQHYSTFDSLVCSYEFLEAKFPEDVDPNIHKAFMEAGDLQGAVIAKHANRNELCRRTMEIFTAAYGAEAGVAGLKWLPFGGLYLAGGLTPKNLDWLRGTPCILTVIDCTEAWVFRTR